MQGNFRKVQIDFVSDSCAISKKNIKDYLRISPVGHLCIQLIFNEHLPMANPPFTC